MVNFITAGRCGNCTGTIDRSAPFIGEEVGGRVEATSLFGRGCHVEDVEVAEMIYENNLPAS